MYCNLGKKIRSKINIKKLFRERNIREIIWNDVIEKTEKQGDVELPAWFKKKVSNSIDRYESSRNIKHLFAELVNELSKAEDLFKKTVSYRYQLDENCKNFLKKIMNDCYKNNKKGIKRRIWKYFNQIDIISKEVEAFEKYKKNIDTDIAVHKFLTLYERLYELTIKILIEYSYIIAKKTYSSNQNSKKFINKYHKLDKKGESLRRHDLIKFFKETGYWKYGEHCSVLNSKLRNAVSHFNFYPKEKKIKIKDEWITIEELRIEYLNLISFYSYIIGESLKKSDWLKTIKNIKKILNFKL